MLAPMQSIVKLQHISTAEQCGLLKIGVAEQQCAGYCSWVTNFGIEVEARASHEKGKL